MSTNRIALVTGGAGGLGNSICSKLAEKGYRVVLTHSPTNTTIKETLAEMRGQGREFAAYPVDVSDFDSCQRCVAQVQKEIGPIDILINNAGITRDMTFRKMTKVDWDAVMNTNLDSMFNMTKPVVDGMVDRGWGRVINVSSVNGSKGAFGQTN
ncbi:MAG TPA: SDR family NAD(P)-dependent oxidoreductase, partial [Myxococcaceae bacterium]|nr:SDR family NAD(P)-dependent oxidoreductase [Myxococcaceae bacterium]